MHRILLSLVALAAAHAADVCPSAQPQTGEWASWSAKIGARHCVANAVNGTTTVEWLGAGIAEASVAGHLEFAVCCFHSHAEKPAPIRLGTRELTVLTHREGKDAPDEDEADFPDLIEDEAHTRTISIRGTLGDAAHPVRADILLKCSASKFADQFAFQFVVVNRSPDQVEIVWDHLRELERRITPNVQPVAGGKASVFITSTRPREALATVELKTASGALLGRFRFDGFTVRD